MRAVEYHADAKILERHAIVALTAGAIDWHFPLIGIGKGERNGFSSGCGFSLRRCGWSSLRSRSWNGSRGRRCRRRGCRNRHGGTFCTEARGKLAAKGVFRVELLGASDQHRFAFNDIRVRYATVHWTYCRARFMIIKSHAFGAFLRDDVENSVCDCRMFSTIQVPFYAALIDRGVGAFRFTGPTVDALASDHRGHTIRSPLGAGTGQS